MNLSLREIYVPPSKARPVDQVFPLDWQAKPLTPETIKEFLRDHLKASAAYRVRLETDEGAVIGELDVWDTLREQVGIDSAKSR